MGLWESFGSSVEVFECCNRLCKLLITKSCEQLDIVVEKGGGTEN